MLSEQATTLVRLDYSPGWTLWRPARSRRSGWIGDQRKLDSWTILSMLAISSLQTSRSMKVATQRVNNRVALVAGANKGVRLRIANELGRADQTLTLGAHSPEESDGPGHVIHEFDSNREAI